MIKDHLLAIDQSTSGTKALVIDKAGAVVSRNATGHKQLYSAEGYVEHDPMEIYENVVRTVGEALQASGISADRLAALTITNQRETAVMWDKRTGLPVYNAIVWQCQRTTDCCEALKAAGHEPEVRARSGLLLDPYFSASKWSWMLRHVPNLDVLLAEGRLLAGTMDSWLLWKLTGGREHATDYTNASRTALFNIGTLQWDERLCELFGVPESLLPVVKNSDDIFGFTHEPALFLENVPITGIIGDSQAALFGQLCFQPGMAKATYGTGTSVLMNIGEKLTESRSGLVTAIAWGLGGTVTYALEAIIRTSGDCIKWVRDNLGLFDTFEELEWLLGQAPANDGVYLVPAFVGLGAPYWDARVKAAIFGLNRGSGKAQIVRAAIESIAYQVKDAVDLMETESGVPLTELKADGGASENAVLMQFQSDLLGRKVVRSEVAELSAMGSAYIGGTAVGLWASPEAIRKGRSGIAYDPAMLESDRKELYQGWLEAVRTVLDKSGRGRQKATDK